jgi:HupE / UreJ protein
MSSIQPTLEETRRAIDDDQDSRRKFPASAVRVWLREPLLHFLLIGACLFAGYAVLQRHNGGTPSSRQINLTVDDLSQLDAYFESQWHHPPTSEEFAALVEGLLLIVKNRWMLLKTVTAFTCAHSITLAIATLGYAEAPMVPLNATIALSILFLGPEIVKSWRGETSFAIRHPWVVAFAFGLLHGFGFATALTSAGLPRHELPLALLSFNVG